MNELQKRVNETLEQLFSKRSLNQILWDGGYMTCMGPAWYDEEKFSSEMVDYMDEGMTDAHWLYFENNIEETDEEMIEDMSTAFLTMVVSIVEDIIQQQKK